MISTVDKQDPRYPVMRRGKNARFPHADSDAVSRIEVCESVADVTEVLQHTVSAGLRPTVRSGGHCYEDFVVNNPNGVLIDVSLLDHTTAAAGGKSGYQIGPGAVLGVVYTELYRKYNVTVPGGTCYSVAAGGHLSGGGYGLLTRLHGLSVDWITGFDILTVEANGKVIRRHVDRQHEPDLFRALRGSGGGNYGVITNFYFDRLPTAPQTLSTAGVSFPWETMTEEKFVHIVQTYGTYFEGRGQEPDTWPMFTFMGLTHKGPNGRIYISASWHDLDGKNDLSVPNEFLDLFLKCGDASAVDEALLTSHQIPTGRPPEPSPCIAGKHRYTTGPWLDATVGGNGGAGANGTTRGKYKSCYMKKNFTPDELHRIYAQLTRDIPGMNPGGIIAVDSYGGAVNKAHLADETAMPQRASIMKLQYQMYWQNPAEDEARLKYFDELYTDIYSANVDASHAGTPFHNEYYEGCYINYPDADMIRYPFWPELYYGQKGLYPFLQKVKKKYDPNNIFHHGMAIRT
ncbi:MAG: Berberine/berberine domain protein [Acidobacteriaceae bacterium]|nr:Berberine/berberine domain protein [Acidobacteriaceae bacterium]